MNGRVRVPEPLNEPVRSFQPGGLDRASIKQRLSDLSANSREIPLRIGGKEVRTGNTARAVMPHNHGHILATWHKAGAGEAEQAIQAALRARRDWSQWRFEDRAAVFLRAADLLATTMRDTVNAATMLNQSKTVHQSEIDAVCEMIDFLRFNVYFAERIYNEQPLSVSGMWNSLEYRPLEGFIYAVSPFNFTSIGGNLPSAPAIMGNTVLWKCASATVYSNHYLAELFERAGLPPGVINFLPGDASTVSDPVLAHRDLAGIHFTGSTEVFQEMWRRVGSGISSYRGYPRLVGETGGKDFLIAHASADAAEVATAIIRGGYEFQGQKCSAVSRVYVPDVLWKSLRERLIDTIKSIRMGDVSDFRNFMGAVIDEKAFAKIAGYIEHARHSADASILAGGGADKSVGYFVEPTLIQAATPEYRTMSEEIFGPVVTVYVYPEQDWEATLELVDRTSPYALTGAVFASDARAVHQARTALQYAAGNFYINDKPTGAVVGQQPFGGARASGTNDKAGSMLNLLRWTSPRSVKETFVPASSYQYPFMEGE